MSPNDQLATHWLGKLTALRPAIGRGNTAGPAPHKPLLLLCLVDLAECGELMSRTFSRTPGLVLRFRTYGTLVAERWPTRLEVRLPFFHLHNQEFWEAFTADQRSATSPDDCAFCELNPGFHALLADPDFRLKARMVLISHYFEPIERVALIETLGIEASLADCAGNERTLAAALEAARRKGRGAKFKIRVVDDYRHTCALTGYRCFTTEGASIVDAAHIEGWAETQNDAVTNGLALSKSAHWMFDQGLWSADDDMRVIVNPRRFMEAGPESLQLRSLAGRHLQFDPQAKLRPALESLRHHRARHHAGVGVI